MPNKSTIPLKVETGKCKECEFYTETHIDKEQLIALGQCRRFPPTNFQIVQQSNQGISINNNSSYVPVRSDNPICGEFSPSFPN